MCTCSPSNILVTSSTSELGLFANRALLYKAAQIAPSPHLHMDRHHAACPISHQLSPGLHHLPIRNCCLPEPSGLPIVA